MDIFDAHQIGANTVAWGPVHEDNYSVEDLSANQSNATGLSLVRLASGGCDNLIKFWRQVDDMSCIIAPLFVYVALFVDSMKQSASGSLAVSH